MARKDKKNDKRRLTARERAVDLSKWLVGYGAVSTKDFVNAASKAFQAHARATLARRDERIQKRHEAFVRKYEV